MQELPKPIRIGSCNIQLGQSVTTHATTNMVRLGSVLKTVTTLANTSKQVSTTTRNYLILLSEHRE